MYNPWSAVRFVKDLVVNKNVFLSSYWANTSSNSIVIKSLIEKADTKTKQEIEILIEGKTIEKLVHEDITYDELRQEGYENIIKYLISFYKKDCIIKLG
ncbi:hypothetical protein ACN077_24410 [Clostridium chromiireducens]|uniref:hypothetical protein n=1 Tax=Clostridium chromiireducens TaxID=225345 RepID=UPI003AF7DF1F